MSEKSLGFWTQKASKISIESRAYINGQYVDALSGKTRPVFNPATGEKLADVASCDREDADLAIKSARDAFQSGVWSRMAPMDRKMIMVRWAELIEKHGDELAVLECLDVGKPIADTTGIDVPSAVRTIRWTGEAIDKIYSEIAPTPAGSLALIQRKPLGVIAAITPWNFPLSTTAWKLAPSLGAGNSVILKPASNTPLTALRIAELASQAGLPDGVLQVLPGPGGSLGEYIATHMDVVGLTFTGSTPVGKQLMIYCGQSNLKRTFLELGGKSPHIIFEDADLDAAAAMAACGVFYNSGQTCTAGTRVIVQDSIHDIFLEKVIEASKGWAPGNPLDPKTNMGPMIDESQFATSCEYIEIGLKENAELVFGGNRCDVHAGGHYLEPTILTNVHNDMRVAREEIFGPVMSVLKFNTREEAVKIANDSIFGLAGGVWSNNINTALSVADQVDVGTMGVNNYFGGDITVPFGGFKQSGNGRDKSLHAFDDYSELKTTWIEVS